MSVTPLLEESQVRLATLISYNLTKKDEQDQPCATTVGVEVCSIQYHNLPTIMDLMYDWGSRPARDECWELDAWHRISCGKDSKNLSNISGNRR
jgi:hypothetical protein